MYSLFFFNDTATTEIYTLSLHDALPIFPQIRGCTASWLSIPRSENHRKTPTSLSRSEEHTSELQSHLNLVCRLLLEKKKQTQQRVTMPTYVSQTTSDTYSPQRPPYTARA